MGLNGHRGRAGVCPCAGWHRVGQWAARGIKGSRGGYAAGRRALPALDLGLYQEAQSSRLLPVTASRYADVVEALKLFDESIARLAGNGRAVPAGE